ncbi:hypothetical protein MWH25_11540, partial [Natroniella acetigena]|uniref:hypothetical protein n=1 Tax=Natroniella acetigena TaxID=52004 RepID=UPI00200AC08D
NKKDKNKKDKNKKDKNKKDKNKKDKFIANIIKSKLTAGILKKQEEKEIYEIGRDKGYTNKEIESMLSATLKKTNKSHGRKVVNFLKIILNTVIGLFKNISSNFKNKKETESKKTILERLVIRLINFVQVVRLMLNIFIKLVKSFPSKFPSFLKTIFVIYVVGVIFSIIGSAFGMIGFFLWGLIIIAIILKFFLYDLAKKIWDICMSSSITNKRIVMSRSSFLVGTIIMFIFIIAFAIVIDYYSGFLSLVFAFGYGIYLSKFNKILEIIDNYK